MPDKPQTITPAPYLATGISRGADVNHGSYLMLNLEMGVSVELTVENLRTEDTMALARLLNRIERVALHKVPE